MTLYDRFRNAAGRKILRGAALMAVGLACCLFSGRAAWAVLPNPRMHLADFITAAARSLVAVRYTATDEFGKSTKIDGQGLLLNKQGVVLISGSLIPPVIPLSYIRHLRVCTAGVNDKPVPAVYLGRTVSGLFCYLKAKHPLKAIPFTPSPHADIQLGEKVVSVGLLSKSEAYRPYIGINRIKAIMLDEHRLALTEVFGLTNATSPVYAFRSGALVGLTANNTGESISLGLLGRDLPVTIADQAQEGLFLPWSEIRGVLAHVPEKPFITRRPWLGIVDETGIKPALRRLYKIKQNAGIVVGGVIPGQPAAKAGLKSQDIILDINGKPFSSSSVPSRMIAAFQRAMLKVKPGQKIKLTLVRNGSKTITLPVTIGVMPPSPVRVHRYVDRRIGMVVRDVAFEDTYARKLPASQKGVIVSLVKDGAPVTLGHTPLKPGYLITRINNQPVTGGRQFMQLLHGALKAVAGEIVFVVIKPDANTAVCRISLQ